MTLDGMIKEVGIDGKMKEKEKQTLGDVSAEKSARGRGKGKRLTRPVGSWVGEISDQIHWFLAS